MRTVKQAAEASGIPETLIRSVIRQIGDKDSLRDVLRGGADAGFAGFTYYADTVAFFKRNRKAIVALAEQMASDLGETTPIGLVSGFRCLCGDSSNNAVPDAGLEKAVATALYGRIPANDYYVDQVANALAWFALEEVARAVADE